MSPSSNSTMVASTASANDCPPRSSRTTSSLAPLLRRPLVGRLAWLGPARRRRGLGGFGVGLRHPSCPGDGGDAAPVTSVVRQRLGSCFRSDKWAPRSGPCSGASIGPRSEAHRRLRATGDRATARAASVRRAIAAGRTGDAGKQELGVVERRAAARRSRPGVTPWTASTTSPAPAASSSELPRGEAGGPEVERALLAVGVADRGELVEHAGRGSNASPASRWRTRSTTRTRRRQPAAGRERGGDAAERRRSSSSPPEQPEAALAEADRGVELAGEGRARGRRARSNVPRPGPRRGRGSARARRSRATGRRRRPRCRAEPARARAGPGRTRRRAPASPARARARSTRNVDLLLGPLGERVAQVRRAEELGDRSNQYRRSRAARRSSQSSNTQYRSPTTVARAARPRSHRARQHGTIDFPTINGFEHSMSRSPMSYDVPDGGNSHGLAHRRPHWGARASALERVPP